MTSRISKIAVLGLLTLAFIWPSVTLATTGNLVFSVWIPYWKKTAAVPETLAHLDQLNSISPFSYEVKPDGTLIDRMKITQAPWPDLISAARAKKITIIPSILWTDAQAMQGNFFNYKKRQAHIAAIVKVVLVNNFDGIDIDYEGKLAETKPYFSKFIRELSVALHAKKKILVCTIEPRTPAASRFDQMPIDLKYANDYATLNLACDQVRLMAYDQMNIDLRLNERKGQGAHYAPVADKDWVVKVITLAKQSISAKKLVLGIANYGYEFEVTGASGRYTYKKVRAVSYQTFMNLAKTQNIVPTRNPAGELGFTYLATNGKTRVLSLSDSVAIANRIKIARNFKLA
ncbi:MAG: glycosyl hydrolase family 18 protein, partial [Patescibacteria group bacterium]